MSPRTKKQQREYENKLESIITLAAIIALIAFASSKTTGIIVLIIYLIIATIAIKLHFPKKNRLLRKSLQEIDQMDGYEFEKYMKALYESLGYSVKHTSLSGDQGADLILKSSDGERTAVQVKRYSGNVPNKAVQEVVASKALYKCTKGIVVTNSYFTGPAVELAKANNIELVDRKKLGEMIKEVAAILKNKEKKVATPAMQKQTKSSTQAAFIPEIRTDNKSDWMSEAQRKEFEAKFSK